MQCFSPTLRNPNMSTSANNLPLVPGNWRSGSVSNSSNSWNRPSPAIPPISYTPTFFREGGHISGTYNNLPSVRGNWRPQSDPDVGDHNNLPSVRENWRPRNDPDVGDHNNWSRPSQGPRSLPYRPGGTSGGGQDPWRLFEDRVRTGPFGLNSFPLHPFSPLRVVVLDNENEMPQEVNPRLRRFIQESPPRIRGQWQMQLAPEEDESRLTQEEQRKALKKLKKEIYNPFPKNKNKRWNLYYRDNPITNYSTRGQNKDEDGKGCAICLEDFVPKQEVLVTPCNHMFHDDCIIPWVKSNGQCPVCRFAIGERRGDRRETTPLHNNNNRNMEADLRTVDLISLIRAMEEAFEWVNVPR